MDEDLSASDDITKDTGSTGTSNLQDGTYTDTPYESTGSGTVTLNPHGTIFTNTTPVNGATAYTAANKFAYNFGKLFKTVDNTVSCSGSTCTFTTVDGMSWSVLDNFSNTSLKNAIITVDVNGPDAGSNSSTNNPDTFQFKVDAGGGVSVYGNNTAATKAKEILKKRKNK